jgi:hypothetical protein
MSNVISSNTDLKLDQNTKEAISRLLVCAAHSIDNNLLENWPLCFKDNATYKILTRADFDLGRKVGVWFCDSKAMLVDRVNSIRSVNVFEPHVYRHILGTSEVTQYKDKKYSFGEVVYNMGCVKFKISDLEFNHDPEFIIAYKYLGRFYDRNLNEYIDDDE